MLTVFAVFVMIGASPTSKSFHVAVPSRATAVRMVVLGPPGVGASSLVRRFCVDTFQESGTDSSSSSSSDASSSSTSSFSSSSSSSSSWGARFHSKLLLAAEQVLRFQLWDVPGGDELLAPVYLANAHVCLVCFDLSRPKTLGAATALLRGVPGQVTTFVLCVLFVCLFVLVCFAGFLCCLSWRLQQTTVVLVGCKADLAGEELAPLLNEAAAAALQHGCCFAAATSARDVARGSPIQPLFVRSATMRLQGKQREETEKQLSTVCFVSAILRAPSWVPDS